MRAALISAGSEHGYRVMVMAHLKYYMHLFHDLQITIMRYETAMICANGINVNFNILFNKYVDAKYL